MIELKRISEGEIAGVCGKFSRPENKKEGLHLLAEMGAQAQLEADKEKVEAIVQEIFREIDLRLELSKFGHDIDGWWLADAHLQALKQKYVKEVKDGIHSKRGETKQG